jgi:hypothetical protein
MPETLKSVTGVWSALDASDMMFPPVELLRGRLPAQATGAGAGYTGWLLVRTRAADG